MTLINKKVTLAELLNTKELYFRIYTQVTDFDKILQLESQVIEPIDKILKAYDKKYKQLQDELHKDESKKPELDKTLNEILNTEVEFKLAVVSQEEVKKAGLNVFEYRLIKDIVKKEGKIK